MLIDHDACGRQLRRFRRTFPDGAPVTVEAAAQARAAGLDVGWAACLLPPEIRARYEAQISTLLADYNHKVAALRASYDAEADPIRIRHEADLAALRARYDAENPMLARQVYTLCSRFDTEIAQIQARHHHAETAALRPRRNALDAILVGFLSSVISGGRGVC